MTALFGDPAPTKMTTRERVNAAMMFPGFAAMRPPERSERNDSEWLKDRGVTARTNEFAVLNNQETIWLVSDGAIRPAVIDLDSRTVIRFAEIDHCLDCGYPETAHAFRERSIKACHVFRGKPVERKH